MIELGLARIARLLNHTPQSWKAIHVAGTNGKGSICAYLSAMLHASGVQCSRFNSPHLIDRWDCITVNEQTVQHLVFREAENLVLKRNKNDRIDASEFELLTATAFEIFAREKVEIGVVEVGLGGRLDATNAMENKAVTVISKIGLDHQSFLGNTIEEIARQKAGIMRAGVPCVVDRSNPPEVQKVINDYAKEIGTDVILSSTESLLDELSEEDFEPHQWENLACAYTAFNLAYTKQQPPCHRLLPAIKNINWPGRLQTIDIRKVAAGRHESVLLDGAHNVQSAEVLGLYVNGKLRPEASKVTWVLAASQGKEVNGIMKILLHKGDCVAAVQFGPVDGMPWVEALAPQDILAAASSSGLAAYQQYNAGGDLSGALRWAVEIAAGGPIVIAGSLYLVSDVLRLLRNAEK